MAQSTLTDSIGARIVDSVTAANQASILAGGPGDNINLGTYNYLGAAALLFAYNGSGIDKVRTPNVFKTIQASAAGDTALWTPAAGKKFRLMRLKIDVPANCTLAARGVEIIKLRDGTTDLNLTSDAWLGQTAPVETASSIPENFTTGWLDLGNGALSALANNVLNVNLGTALSAGNVRVTCCGTEE